jgi:hypothetical protein
MSGVDTVIVGTEARASESEAEWMESIVLG